MKHLKTFENIYRPNKSEQPSKLLPGKIYKHINDDVLYVGYSGVDKYPNLCLILRDDRHYGFGMPIEWIPGINRSLHNTEYEDVIDYIKQNPENGKKLINRLKSQKIKGNPLQTEVYDRMLNFINGDEDISDYFDWNDLGIL